MIEGVLLIDSMFNAAILLEAADAVTQTAHIAVPFKTGIVLHRLVSDQLKISTFSVRTLGTQLRSTRGSIS